MIKKRKNKALPMLILIGLLVVLLIGYSALSSANDRREAEEAAKTEAENAQTFIAEYDYTTTAKLSYQREGDEKITLLQNAGVWSYADDSNFPLNQTIAAQMAYAISTIAVETKITDGTAADYGLDSPAYLIEISYSDGTKHTYKIGNYNSFNGAYYFSMDGDLYMIASGLIPYFDYTLNDLLALDTLPTSDWAELGYVNEITVTNGDVSAVITDEAGKESAVAAIGNISFSSWADWYADESEKSAYGLVPAVTVKYKKAVTTTDENGNSSTSYLETSYTLNIGVDADGTYYANPAKSNIVYTIDAEAAEAILAFADYVPAAE